MSYAAKNNNSQVNVVSDMIRARISKHVNLSALGNSNRSMRDLAVDLINQSKLDHEEIATGCFLCKQTISNLADDITRHPQDQTLERIFRFFNFKVSLVEEKIKAQYANKPKEEI